MDDQYLDAFIRESEEAITELNNSLLALESDPDDREAMDQIFRTAHTLKGNFGAMGFEDAAALAHAMEDLLDAMRQGELEVTPEVMDLIFAAVDEIETIVGEIEAEGESAADTEATVAQLRAVLDGEAPGTAGAGAAGGGGGSDSSADGGDGGDGSSERGSLPAGFDPDAAGIDPATVEGRVAHVEIGVGETEMAGVDAMLAIEAVEEAFDVLAVLPDRAGVEDGDYEGRFGLIVATAELGRLDAELDAAGPVETATVTDVTDALAGDAKAETGDGDKKADESDGEHLESGESGDGESSDGESGGDGRGDATDASGDGDGVDEIKSVRVDVDQLDDLHGLVEQLVTSRIKLRRSIEAENVDGAGETLDELDKITDDLQNTVMDMRLIPLRKVVGKFPRMVRDLARELDKEIDFEIEGGDIELDRTILTEISDPLMHVIRNALDHGIEPPAERERAGKPREGTVRLRAERERDHVTIRVEDDGAGLDAEEIAEQAVAEGVRTAAEIEAMDDSAIYDLVFHPGFSTSEEVTDVSGRGVGMDVVHDTVTQLDGSVDVDSTPGEGTTVSLRLPVTMAIVKVLFVEVGEEEYGVPLKNVDEITGAGDIKRVNGREVIAHDDELYPVVDLAETFDVPRAATDGGSADGSASDPADDAGNADDDRDGDAGVGKEGMLVRIRESERQVALRCDAVNAQEEVVVKPLEGLLSGTPGLSGTAVLGDGNIVHILDVVTL